MLFQVVVIHPAAHTPICHVLPAWDCIAGQTVALALLAAERHRRNTGQGQLVELALKDVALATLGHLGILGEVMINGVDRAKYGNSIVWRLWAGLRNRRWAARDGGRPDQSAM